MNVHTTVEDLIDGREPRFFYREVIWIHENDTKDLSDLIANENLCLDFLKYPIEFYGNDIIFHYIARSSAKAFQKVSIFYHINVFSRTFL